METKYYTPERNEFHEGFVFEANYKKEGWQKEIFGVGERSISSVPQLLYQFLDGAPLEGNIRVKLLDREDIEKCLENKYILFTFDNDIVTLEINNQIKFIGKCKNKSELKKIVEFIEY